MLYKRKLTKEMALIACADYWNLIGHMRTYDKLQAAKLLWPNLNIHCWACVYSISKSPKICEKCPIWSPSNPCSKLGSPYTNFCRTASNAPEDAQKYAWEIRDLALHKLSQLYKKSYKGASI